MSLSHILRSLRDGMSTPERVHCGDGHFRRVIFGLGPYIADYPEQALVSCIVQSWCPVYEAITSSTGLILTMLPSCTADKNNLDGSSFRMNRSREHTETAVRALELGELWQRYGIVGDIVVGCLIRNM